MFRLSVDELNNMYEFWTQFRWNSAKIYKHMSSKGPSTATAFVFVLVKKYSALINMLKVLQ